MKTIFKSLLPVFILLFTFSSEAQQNFVIAGGTFYRPTGNISLSLGQVFYQANPSQAGSESQGVQQAFDIKKVYPNFNFHFSVYPNPVQNNLMIESEDYKGLNFRYFLVDEWGRILLNEPISDHLTNIDMQGLSRATYYLIIKKEQTKINVYKIIKK